MDRAVMRAAQRDGEFIADLAAEGPRLQVAQMVRVGLFAAADEAGLLRDKAKMLAVAIAPRRRDREHALVDAGGPIDRPAVVGRDVLSISSDRNGSCRRCGGVGLSLRRLGGREIRQPALEGILHQLGIARGETVLGGECLTCPDLGEIGRRDGRKLSQQLLPQGGRCIRRQRGWRFAIHAAGTMAVAGLARWPPSLSVRRGERVINCRS